MAKKELALFSELDRMFERPFFAAGFKWPMLRPVGFPAEWSPEIEVFERDNQLVTKIDLPGMKKEEVKVEVTDGHLVISGERKSENEERRENVYRSERSYGSFYRAVPLPDGVKLEDVKASFAAGVLEVTVPLVAKAEPKPRQVEIHDGAQPAKSAA